MKNLQNDLVERKVKIYALNFMDNLCNKFESQNDKLLNTNEAISKINDLEHKMNKHSLKKTILQRNKSNNSLKPNDDGLNINRVINTRFCLDSNSVHPLISENVIKLQRAFKRYYIKKKSLPGNFFFTQKILNYQYAKRNKNFEDNFRILFPIFDKNEKIDFDKTFDTIKSTRYKLNVNENNGKIIPNMIHNPYEDGKIHLFAKIIDIDIMVKQINLISFIIFLK